MLSVNLVDNENKSQSLTCITALQYRDSALARLWHVNKNSKKIKKKPGHTDYATRELS